MRNEILVFALAVVATALPAPASAQYALDQPRSLKGLQQVCVNFAAASPNITGDRIARLASNVTLELRKTGLRILDCPPERMDEQRDLGSDGLLNVTVEAEDATLANDGIRMRMDVEQNVTILRTAERLRLVTWYHEAEARPTSWEPVLDEFVLEQVNRFLADWLAANGR